MGVQLNLKRVRQQSLGMDSERIVRKTWSVIFRHLPLSIYNVDKIYCEWPTNNLLNEFCLLEWHSIRNLHLSILPIAPSPFKASWKGSHDKPSLLKDHVCSVYSASDGTGWQRPIPGMWISHLPVPNAFQHSSVPLISYGQHLSKWRISESWCNLRYNSKQAFPPCFFTV